MLSFFQAIILGVVQGATELFPVSSLGHSVILPALFGWHINQNADTFLTFLVATHFATALVLFFIYRKDWIRIIKAIFSSLAEREIKSPDAKLGWLLIVGTIPAGIAGLLFETQLQTLFSIPEFAAGFLILNGFLLFLAEQLRKKASQRSAIQNPDHRIAAELSWWQSIKIGCLQILSLIPGFSRTGSTLAGGLWVGLSHEDTLRYSFLLATPIIGAAALLKLPPLLISGDSQTIAIAATGALAAAIAAYASAKFLTRYFKTKTLNPFSIYCIAAGVLSLIILR
jgi:undecaprenyl-diphosphatase